MIFLRLIGALIAIYGIIAMTAGWFAVVQPDPPIWPGYLIVMLIGFLIFAVGRFFDRHG